MNDDIKISKSTFKHENVEDLINTDDKKFIHLFYYYLSLFFLQDMYSKSYQVTYKLPISYL